MEIKNSRSSLDYTITELSNTYNVSLCTLRSYEKLKLLSPRRVGQMRLYSPEDETRLQLILTGRRLNFSLREIGNLIQDSLNDKKNKSTALLDLLDRDTIQCQLNLLENRKSDIDEAIVELQAQLASAVG